MKKILITNDDGIGSEGIARLAAAARKYGEVWVVAPDSQRSAMSHSVTFNRSFDAWEADFPVSGVHAFACTGTPADCVRIGAICIVPDRPDVVLSGINFGYNLATDIQYSATAGAAFEAAFQKLHTIAFSEGQGECHAVTDFYLDRILSELLEKPLEPNKIWNVNFPAIPLADCKGILYDRKVSSDNFYNDRYILTPGQDGRISYLVEGIRNYSAAEGTDLRAVMDHYVSVGKAENIT